MLLRPCSIRRHPIVNVAALFLFLLSFCLPVSLSHQNWLPLLPRENKRARFDTLTQGAEWSQFAFKYFFSEI